MINKLIIVPILLVFLHQTSQKQQTSITFKVKNAGINVKGSFSDIETDVSFNPESPESANFKVRVGVNSIDTGIKGRDRHLKKAKYFNMDEFPYITFQSTKILKTQDGYLSKGMLTIKGTSKNVDIPFEYKVSDGVGSLVGSLELNRRDYSVGGGSLIMGNTVKIDIVYPLEN